MFKPTCPRCKSVRIQLGFKESPGLLGPLGIRELLCNNCGREFRAFAPLGKLRRSQSGEPEVTPNRRRAPRYKAQLRVRLAKISKGREGGEAHAEIAGHTRDVSSIGLAIIIPDTGAARDFADSKSGLTARVELPAGPLKLRVVPVRHVEILTGPEKGHLLIGVHIRGIGEADRAALHRYLETLQP